MERDEQCPAVISRFAARLWSCGLTACLACANDPGNDSNTGEASEEASASAEGSEETTGSTSSGSTTSSGSVSDTSSTTGGGSSSTTESEAGSSSSDTTDGSGGCPDGLCDEMVEVPAGTFMMGCEGSECPASRTPRHEVYLDAFMIDKYEVTQAQYWRCAEQDGCFDDPGVGCMDSVFAEASPSDPMFCVSFEAATRYCERYGKRLPTEAEWEKAAAGTDGRTYPWGEEAPTCELANFAPTPDQEGCGTAAVAPVGSRPAGASAYGAMDMAGNIGEMVSDWYSPDYYAESPHDNPSGPESGSFHVYRGGAFNGGEESLRVVYRFQLQAFGTKTGFRCAKTM